MRWWRRRGPIDLHETLLAEVQAAHEEYTHPDTGWAASPDRIWASSITADKITTGSWSSKPGHVVTVPADTNLWGKFDAGLVWTGEKPTNQFLLDHEGETVAWVDDQGRCWLQTWGDKPMQFTSGL